MCHLIIDGERQEEWTMTITLYRNRTHPSPFGELDSVSSRLNQVFGTRFPDLSLDGAGWAPAVSIEETKDELLVLAEIPGISPADVEVEIENGILTLRGTKEAVREEDHRYHLEERRFGSFLRSFTLPRGVSQEGIDATVQDGVLRIRLPKVQEAKGRKVEIRTGAATQG
jgi:HSP20 family protein